MGVMSQTEFAVKIRWGVRDSISPAAVHRNKLSPRAASDRARVITPIIADAISDKIHTTGRPRGNREHLLSPNIFD